MMAMGLGLRIVPLLCGDKRRAGRRDGLLQYAGLTSGLCWRQFYHRLHILMVVAIAVYYNCAVFKFN